MPGIDIGVDFCGIHLSTPFLIASAPSTTRIGEIYKHAEQIAKNGWSGVVTKTVITKEKYDPELKPYLWTTPQFRIVAMQNAGPQLDIYSKSLLKELKRDTEAAHAAGIKVIVSIIGSTYGQWGEMANECEQAGADGIELNLSCPSYRPTMQSSMGGARVGGDPEEAGRAVEATVSGTNLPVIAKLTVHASDISAVATACQEAGCSAISAINTVRGLIGIDIQTEMPLSSDIEGRCHYSGLSGPLIKPIALGICANLALSVDVPISAIGGIVDWRDTVEFLLAGASNVQVGTGMMWYGLGLGTRLRRGLESYMAKKGYSSIQDFRGHALRYLVTTEKQDSRGHTVRYISTAAIPEAYPSDCRMELSREKCNMCRMCLIACRDASMDAIEEVNGNLRIDRAKCTICGLCMVICKPGAITLKREA